MSETVKVGARDVHPKADLRVKASGGVRTDVGHGASDEEIPVDVATIAAGSNIIGKVGIDQTTPGTTNRVDTAPAITYDHYHYNGSTDNQTIAAAVAGKVTKVHLINLQVQGTVTVSLEDGSGGTKIWQFKGEDREGTNSGFVAYPAHLCQTTANTALVLDLSAAVTVDITVIYSDEDAS